MAGAAIGLDVGGSKVAAGLVDARTLAVLERIEEPTAPSLPDRGEAVLAQVAGLVARLRATATARGLEVEGVGMGVPELVTRTGEVASRWNFDWRGLDLPARLGEPTLVVESDVRAAALAELRAGHGRGLPSFVLVVAGTGLSYTLCVDGRLHRGARGFAIHFATVDQQPVCAHCDQQGPFNLEGLASAAGLAAHHARRTGAPPADLAGLIDGGRDGPGTRLFEEATTALAAGLAQLVDMLDPHALVLSGGLSRAPRFLAALREKTPPRIFAEAARAVPLLASAVGADGGLVGAACAALER